MTALASEDGDVSALEAQAADHAERCLLADLRSLVQRARTEDLFVVDAAARAMAKGYAEMMARSVVEVAEAVRLHCERDSTELAFDVAGRT